jgi:hypothetical protein
LTAATALTEASGFGVTVAVDGEDLRLGGKTSRLPPDLLAELRLNKPGIIALLRQAACSPRPKGYTDAEWLAAVADARRLGYLPVTMKGTRQ